MIAYPSSMSLYWGKFCSNILIDECNVMAHNMEWEGYSMHITIYNVKTTLQLMES
jgi:hypothetical protein